MTVRGRRQSRPAVGNQELTDQNAALAELAEKPGEKTSNHLACLCQFVTWRHQKALPALTVWLREPGAGRDRCPKAWRLPTPGARRLGRDWKEGSETPSPGHQGLV